MASTSQPGLPAHGNANISSMPLELDWQIIGYLSPEDHFYFSQMCRQFFDSVHSSPSWKLDTLLTCPRCRIKHPKSHFAPVMKGEYDKNWACDSQKKRINVFPDVWLSFKEVQSLANLSPIRGETLVGTTTHTYNSKAGTDAKPITFPARYRAINVEPDFEAWADCVMTIDHNERVSIEMCVKLTVKKLHVSDGGLPIPSSSDGRKLYSIGISLCVRT